MDQNDYNDELEQLEPNTGDFNINESFEEDLDDDIIEEFDDGKSDGSSEIIQEQKVNNFNSPNRTWRDKVNNSINPLGANQKNRLFQTKLNSAKKKTNPANHPAEGLKNKSSDVAKSTAKEAGQQVKKTVINVGKAVGKLIIQGITKIIAFIMSNPYLAIGALALAFLLLLLILFFGGSSAENENVLAGYYDATCNYNETNINFTSCSGERSNHLMNIEDYVIGATYAYSKDGYYSDDVIKAFMIVVKTNALSRGRYNSSSKSIELNDCEINYVNISEIPDDDLEELKNSYEDVSSYLYVSESYNSVISNLSNANILSFDENTLDNFQENNNSYEEILNDYYGNRENEDLDSDLIYRENLFIGDSRTQGMMQAKVINSDNTVYGVGYGYNWFIGNGTFNGTTNASNGAINAANEKMRENTSYNIIIWLGVNDYLTYNAETYYNKYYELANGEWSNHNLYVVSVGPVDDSKAVYVNNEGITNFNNELSLLVNNSSLSNLKYIDLNYDESSIISYDSEGLHYSNEDYKNIYEIIINNIENNVSSNLKLYNLGDYCTFYSIVTENEAYWWPIGSRVATSGNIYAGEPMSTRITSVFGNRNIDVPGASTNHGGIDIASSACSDVPIIATKRGTVTYVNDGCVEGDINCGGGFGNWVKIDHGEGIVSIYGHMSLNTIQVKENDVVEQGQIIGRMGSTGTSSGCHLHFEIRINNTKVNPLDYVSFENPRPVKFEEITNVEGTDNKNTVCKSLKQSGIPDSGVIGIMVNMQAESAFNPNIIGDNGTSYGLCQWHLTRWDDLKNYRPDDWETIGGQLSFLLYELQNTFPKIYTEVTGNYPANTVALDFCLDFERPHDKQVNCRIRLNNNLSSITNYVKNNCS